MFTEKIPPKVKSNLVKYGDSDVFGTDAPERRNMTPAERVVRFAQVWPRIAQALAPSDTLIKHAESLIPAIARDYFNEGDEHRMASVDGVAFIAQFNRSTNVCTQLWFMGKNKDLSRLSVRFESIEERDSFCSRAHELGCEADGLAASILCAFSRCASAASDPDFDADTLNQMILFEFGLKLRRPKVK